MNRELDPQSRVAVHATSAVAALVAAVLSPLPLVDELLLLPLYGNLAWRLGRAHQLRLTQIPWNPIARTAFAGLTARAGLNLAVAYIPGVAAVANAVSAIALTELLGRYIDQACAHPAEAKPYGIKAMLNKLRPTPTPQAPA